MILANQPPVYIFLIGIGLLIGLVVGALYFFRGYEYFAGRALVRKYADLEVHTDPQPGDVILSYHTYHGFIAWFTQTPHQVALPPAEARKLLGRLLRFNLSWGLVTPGAIFIPALVILNYYEQRRSIAAQEAAGGLSASSFQPADASIEGGPDTAENTNTESPSSFRQLVGWIAAGLCVLFGIVTVVSLFNDDFEALFGGVVITGLLGWVARDWIGQPK